MCVGMMCIFIIFANHFLLTTEISFNNGYKRQGTYTNDETVFFA